MILTDNEYKEFKKVIQNYFEQKNKTIVFVDDYTLETQTDQLYRQMYYLTNIAKICKKEEQEKWVELITEFYDKFENYDAINDTLKNRKEDFEYYKQFIGVRFYHKDYFSSHDFRKNYLYLPMLEDVYLALVLDLPDHITNLDPKLLQHWNISEKELFFVGMSNIMNKYDFKINLKMIRGVPIYLIAANHYFSNIIVFALSKYEELVGDYGSLFCIPNRHEIYIHPINGLGVEKALESLIYVVKDRYDEPGSLSQNLYWLYDKKFTKQEITFVENNVFVRLSKEFREVLTEMKTTASRTKSRLSYI